MSGQLSEPNPALRLTGSTRSEILRLLRRGPCTVQDLEADLGISGNAVRGHLHALGRERLVEQRGVRRDTGGKPAHLFALTGEAERLFPKAYAAVLGRVLDAVGQRLGEHERDRIMRGIGQEVARDLAPEDTDGLVDRVRAAAGVLDGLGGATRIEEDDDGFTIRGNGCPVGQLVAGHPELCRMAQALVAAITGTRVLETCDRGDPPSCSFEIPKA